MKNFRLGVIISIAFSSVLFSAAVTRVSSADTAVIAKATPTSTPRSKPTPAILGTPVPAPTATPAAKASPTPDRTQTLEELQTKIRNRMLASEVRRGRVGIKIVSLNSGKVIFENDADKYFTPASNMKNFTVAAALEKLGPDFKFKTEVRGAKPDKSGTVNGDLQIIGGGDVSLSNAFDPAFPGVVNPYWGIDKLVDKIATAGVKRVEGDLIGNEQHFWGFATPETWEWDDMQTFSGAEVSALPLNDNVVDLRVKPAAAASGAAPCLISITPPIPIMQIVNNCNTAPGDKQDLRVTKRIDQNIIEVDGYMGVASKENVRSITFSHVAELFMSILKDRLEARGITVTGKTRTIDNSVENTRPPSGRAASQFNKNPNDSPVSLAMLESPPFSVIAAKTMKPSQNMYTETILWTLGEDFRPNYDPTVLPGMRSHENSSELGLMVVKTFLEKAGIPQDSIIQYDGSGMSRHDVITPSAVVQLYTYMAKQSKNSQIWYDSLSIGGIDGTLRNRFKGTPAEGNMRGKTGTLDQVSALSGYVTTRAGEKLIVSIIVNAVAKTSDRTSLADDIVVSLANFSGKID